MRSILSICLLFISGYKLASAVDTADPFCEGECTSCCNVNNDTQFEYKNVIALTFPDVSLTGKYTILDPGTHMIGSTEYEGSRYQEVIRYENDVKASFLYNVRIYTVDSQTNLSCDESAFYYDGQKFDLELVSSSLDYCRIAGINGIINSTKLGDYTTTSGAYFAFYKLVEERSNYQIMFDDTNRIIPRDDIFDYQFFVNTTTVSNDNDGSNYFIHIDVLVSDINSMEVDGECAGIDTIMNMSNGYVHVGASEECQLEYYEVPSGDVEGSGRLFRYTLPQSRYEECAESFTNDGNNIIFKTTLYTPTFETLSDTCYYFQPGFSEQEISITMDADISAGVTEQFEQFSVELVNVELERCTPIEDYVIPQATTVFTFNATFVGDTDSVDWLYGSLPYLSGYSSGETNFLYGFGDSYGIGLGNGEFKTCTGPLTDGNETYRVCTFKMKTDLCEKIYVTDSGQCGFERNATRFIHNLEFKEEYSGGLFITHRTPRLDSGLEFMLFPEEQCSAPDERPIINVNDEFPTKLIVRNYYQNVNVNWTNTTNINFQDRVTLRLGVGEASGIVLNDISVMLKTVLVTLRDPVTNVVLTQYSFNVAEKETFMDVTWSLYHSDPIFCTWYDAADAGSDKCQPFYGVSYGRSPSPWTQSQLDHVCKRNDEDSLESDSRNVDYWSFDPKKWFVDLYDRPYLKVTFTINAVLQTCGDSGSDPASGDRRRLGRKLQTSNAVRYVSDELVVVFGTDEDGNDQTTVIRDGANSVAKDYMPLIIGVSVSGGIFLLLVMAIVCHRSGNSRYVQVTRENHNHLY